MPRIGGLRSGDTGLADENEEAIPEFSNASCQRFNIVCSGGKDGCVCFSIFGIFPVGKIASKYSNSLVHNLNSTKNSLSCMLSPASAFPVIGSGDLSTLTAPLEICSTQKYFVKLICSFKQSK